MEEEVRHILFIITDRDETDSGQRGRGRGIRVERKGRD